MSQIIRQLNQINFPELKSSEAQESQLSLNFQDSKIFLGASLRFSDKVYLSHWSGDGKSRIFSGHQPIGFREVIKYIEDKVTNA